MNGVRRLLGAATGSSSSSSTQPALDSPQETPRALHQIAPLAFSTKNGPSWPPSPPSSLPGDRAVIPTTPALSVKKDKPQPPLPPEPNDSRPNITNYSSRTSMSPITRLRGSMSTTSSPVKQNGVLSNSSPSTPSSSPRALPGRLITRKSVPRADSEPNWKRASTTLNTRDELLMSLLASEAVIDSRDFDILSSEEVEELKKEHQVLQSRLVALTKKLSLESKIRDAARSLVRVNASNKKVSKQSEEQLDAATRRVEAVQADLWRVSERAHDVHKRLMEHRAGVLSLSVRSMEKKLAPRPKSGDSGYDSPSRHETPLLSPSMSITSGFSSQSRFDGAHFFAGHADAILPKRTFSAGAATTEIASLEERLKAATDALTAAGKKQAELSRELSMLRLEKQEVETTMTLELQSATETISALEEELPRLEKMDSEIQQLQQEKSKWEQDRPILEERARQADELQVRLAGMESRDGETAAIQKILGDERERSCRELEDKETEIQRLKETWAEEREQWEGQKALWEDEKMEDLARLQDEMERLREEDLQALQRAHQELDEGLSVLQALIQSHGIVLFSRESTMLGLAEAISSHLHNVHMRLEGCLKAEEEWSTMRRKMEEDIRSGLDKREALQSELGEARRERDAVTLELNRAISRLEDQVKIGSPALTTANLPPIDIDIPTDTDVGKVTSLLLPLWAILPSPEARVAKFGTSQRPFRTGSPVMTTNTMSAPPKSIADLDVRSLKTLYDSTRNVPGSPHVGTGGTFTFEAFATRVQALIQDDRALIERLIRFAQAHELLRKNAERAQKLAQEGANSLETYQKQVKTLEERNTTLSSRILALQEDIQVLQDNIERITAERLELEANAAEQAETCLQLTEANNALSARTLILAEEAASAPEMIRKQLEAQLAECRNALNIAQTEADEMRMSEQTQRIALMDELNSVQTENSRLRDQLRAVKK